MKLIILAHRGEAQSFIRALELNLIDEKLALYHDLDKKIALVISGEGIYGVLTKLPFIIASFEITEILNFGIAGALDQGLTLGEVYSIRTSYAHNEKSPEFHSYTSLDESAGVDCITNHERVHSSEVCKKLENFAAIVDRELWAIGKTADFYKIPYASFKLISDMAGPEVNCFDIKDKAKNFSDKLLAYYYSLELPSIKKKSNINQKITLDINASFTQIKRIEKLWEILSLRTAHSFEQFVETSKQDLGNRKHINAFIESLEDAINPLQTKVKRTIENQFMGFNKIGAQVIYDKKFESSDFTLQMKINSQSNLDNLTNAITEFKLAHYLQVWEGNVQ
jgi:hypothetical protein